MMDEAKRNDIAMKAGVQALAAQRNQALDACAQLQSDLAVARAELEETRAQLAVLKAAKEEAAKAEPGEGNGSP